MTLRETILRALASSDPRRSNAICLTQPAVQRDRDLDGWALALDWSPLRLCSDAHRTALAAYYDRGMSDYEVRDWMRLGSCEEARELRREAEELVRGALEAMEREHLSKCE